MSKKTECPSDGTELGKATCDCGNHPSHQPEDKKAKEEPARAETGPLQFGEDWPGVFIRGDNAESYAQALKKFREGESRSPFEETALDSLLILLQDANVERKAQVQKALDWKEARVAKEGATYKEMATDLASCVLWALKFLKTPGGSGMWCGTSKDGEMVTKPWQERFMDALDKCGYVIDREAFWEPKDKKKGKPAKKPAKKGK